MTRFIKTRQDKKVHQKVNYTSGNNITMCKGGKCPFKDMCHRYTAIPDEIYQSWFVKPPFKIKKGKPECDMFWGAAANQLFVTLTEIMKSKKKKPKS